MENEQKNVKEGDCTDCQYRGASFREVKYFCNKIKKFVDIQYCEHYVRESIFKKLAEKSQLELEAEKDCRDNPTIENESLNKILDFYANDCSWTKLRRILTKDIISTTVLLNYLEYNQNAKKKFMSAILTMSLKELEKLGLND
ncbi:MAG: hypothetical protein FWE23_07500 [Chitinivibrionia bacterium]|nr:hypothetical protein [Chitinivibrionia bacterium]